MLKLFKRKHKDNYVPAIQGQQLYTVKQAALFLGRSEYSLRCLIWKGALDVVQDGRKMWLDLDDLKKWIQTNKIHQGN